MSIPDALQKLADSYGIQTSYDDDQDRRQEATVEAIRATLRVFGTALERVEDADDALRQRRQTQWQRLVEPVTLAWDGKAAAVNLRIPARQADGLLSCRLELDAGESRVWSASLADLPVKHSVEVEGVEYQVRSVNLPETLPLGYHQLGLEFKGRTADSLLLAAPVQSYPPQHPRTWGVFLPVYAIRSARNWGAGDFTDLGALIDWVQERGGGLVGTLPLLAAFLGVPGPEPFEPSPYSPASRLFWNEFYLDVQKIPELADHANARDLIASVDFQRECADLRGQALVDYQRVMALKWRVLCELAGDFFSHRSERFAVLQKYRADNPRLEDYARFRAAGERNHGPWPTWPEPQRSGSLQEGDFDERVRDYYLFVQWQTDEQLRALAYKSHVKGPGLYLDYPLGVHADSYDVWRERSSFALGVSAGAPPDVFFTMGQDWGFPPLHPENIRTDSYRYLRACLHHQLRYAGIMRIDHMMGLHRFYWVPHELGAQHGVYVSYPAEELYAVFSLEANRHRAVLVGEDLGTVPPAVRPAMARHRIERLYVGQYELQADLEQPFPPIPEGAVASMNTHDMPTFAAYWEALDVADRQGMGLLDEAGAKRERERRKQIREAVVRALRGMGLLGDTVDLETVLRAALQLLAHGPAQAVLANLEDLWQETQPQNVPGTWRERPNWRRKSQHTLEALEQVPGLMITLRALDRVVRQAEGRSECGRASAEKKQNALARGPGDDTKHESFAEGSRLT